MIRGRAKQLWKKKKLIVENFSFYTIQKLQGQGPGDLWQRTRQGSVWRNWVKIATTDYVDSKKVFSVTIYEAGE